MNNLVAPINATGSVICRVENSVPRRGGSGVLEARGVAEGNVLPHADAGEVGADEAADGAAGDVADVRLLADVVVVARQFVERALRRRDEHGRGHDERDGENQKSEGGEDFHDDDDDFFFFEKDCLGVLFEKKTFYFILCGNKKKLMK
jgi:hypothetical protein